MHVVMGGELSLTFVKIDTQNNCGMETGVWAGNCCPFTQSSNFKSIYEIKQGTPTNLLLFF